MITQELIDYVKTQLSAGVAREKITSDLLGQGGWTTEQIDEAFNSLGSGIQQETAVVGNKYWTKYIFRTNKWLMILSLILFLGLDLIILIMSPGLFIFWAAMAVVMLIFWGFYRYENTTLKDRYANSSSKLDPWFIALVALRNLVFILNFIPVIQLLGGAALIYGGIPYLIVYYLMVRSRNKLVVAV